MEFPGKFLQQHDEHWEILEHVQWYYCLHLISFDEYSTPSEYHPIMPHFGNIFIGQSFGCIYKDIPEQFHLSQLIWNLMMKIGVVYLLHFQKPKFNVYFLWQVSWGCYCCGNGLLSVSVHIRNVFINSNMIHTFTYLVLEFLLIPVPLFTELFIDSTGDVVIASNNWKFWSDVKC